jgi:hypothetical protein
VDEGEDVAREVWEGYLVLGVLVSLVTRAAERKQKAEDRGQRAEGRG